MESRTKKGLIILSVALTSLVVIGLVLFLVLAAHVPQAGTSSEVFYVPLASTNSQVVSSLEKDGLIKDGWLFRVALILEGQTGTIQPGGYQLSEAMNVWQLAHVLTQPPTLVWVTIPPGLRKEEIAELLAKPLHWTSVQEQDFLTATDVNPDDFEGVYFPDTYLLPVDTTPADAVTRLQSQFETQFAPYQTAALAQNIKWDTLLKIASIIQREAAGSSDAPLISGIIWNRLLANMPLDIDATVQYARDTLQPPVPTATSDGYWTPLKPGDTKIDSPYNSYLHTGLPPHPIDNPGLVAISAALNPQTTTCFYYLHDASGTIHCADTYQEHLQNIQTYLQP